MLSTLLNAHRLEDPGFSEPLSKANVSIIKLGAVVWDKRY